MFKLTFRSVVILALALTMVIGLTGSAFAIEPPEMIKVIIGFEDQPAETEQLLVRSAGGTINRELDLINAYSATVPKQAIDQLRADPTVAYVEVDTVVHATGMLPWGIDRIDAEIVWGGADGATDVIPGRNAGDGIKVAIIDSGIDYDHPDLAANYRGGYDFVNNDNDPMDDEGHGTHCAGIVAAVDNGIGVIGVAPEVELYAVKVLDYDGEGWLSDIIAGFNWAVDNGMNIISYSAGSPSYSTARQQACDNAYDAGLLIVAAAGNDGNPSGTGDTVIYPARYASVIAVAATDQYDQRTAFSATGPDVELAAPGDNIYSTYWPAPYASLPGTSMACPHVSGAAALVWAAYPDWSNDDVRFVLQNTAEDLGNPGRDEWYGYGLVDAAAAVQIPTFSVTLGASPDVISLTIDGTAYSPGELPASFSWATGTVHQCVAPSSVSAGTGTKYVFTSWSDGSTSPSRTISQGGTYTANYKTQHYLTVTSAHGSPAGESWYDAGSTATTGTAEQTVSAGSTRYIFLNWMVDGSTQAGNPVSITMDAPHTAVTNYKTQHYLTVTSAHGSPTGEGWYDEGTTASTVTAEQTVSAGNTRYIFLTWIVDGVSKTGNPVSIAMDAPHTATTSYKTQHYLTVTSEYGDPQGAGWYDEGSTATVSVTSPVGTLIRQFFTGWSGGSTATTPSATVLMSSPQTVTANWRTDYLYLYSLIGGMLGLVLIVFATAIKIRRAKITRASPP